MAPNLLIRSAIFDDLKLNFVGPLAILLGPGLVFLRFGGPMFAGVYELAMPAPPSFAASAYTTAIYNGSDNR